MLKGKDRVIKGIEGLVEKVVILELKSKIDNFKDKLSKMAKSKRI